MICCKARQSVLRASESPMMSSPSKFFHALLFLIDLRLADSFPNVGSSVERVQKRCCRDSRSFSYARKSERLIAQRVRIHHRFRADEHLVRRGVPHFLSKVASSGLRVRSFPR